MTRQQTVGLVVAALLLGAVTERARAITPINLGTLGANSQGQEYSSGAKVNRFGEVTGETTRPGTLLQPFVYSDPFIFSILGAGQNGVGHDLNDVGQVVGRVGRRGFQRRNSGVTLLPPLTPTLYPDSVAFGTNNLNDVVGVSASPGPLPSRIGTLWPGGAPSPVQLPMNIPRDINDSGLVVGDLFAGPVMAMAYDSVNLTPPVPMGTLGGNLSRAFAVNNAGEAVGFSADANNQWHAFVWDAANGMTNLGAAAIGANESRAFDINNHGTVVGQLNFNGVFRAFCWIDGSIIDLNSLLSPSSGWVLQSANGVNDAGWITGEGLFNGERRAYLLRHVPEPAGALVAATACIAAVFRRGRR